MTGRIRRSRITSPVLAMASTSIHPDVARSTLAAVEVVLAVAQTVAVVAHAVIEGVRRFIAVFGNSF